MQRAIQNGDKVAEVILLRCDTTDLFNREKIASICPGSAPNDAARARLEQIGFQPAVPYDKLPGFERVSTNDPPLRLNLQRSMLQKIRSGFLGFPENYLYSAVGNWDVPDEKLHVEIARNSALIEAALEDFPRAFGFGGKEFETGIYTGDPAVAVRMETFSLTREVVKPIQLTWGPALAGDRQMDHRSYHRTMPHEWDICRGGVFMPGHGVCTHYVFGNDPARSKGHAPGYPDPIVYDAQFDADLKALLQQGEAAITRYLDSDPRWAVFLIDRPAHHEFVPRAVQSAATKLADDWHGTWQLVKSFQIRSRDQRFYKDTLPPERNISGELRIARNGDASSATVTTKNTGPLSPPDVSACPLRYSGSTSQFGGGLGWVENFVDNGNNDANIYPSDAFAPFDAKKKYKQVLLACAGGETINSDRVRFLMLSGESLVEVSSAGMHDFPITIRHYQRVDHVEVPLSVDSVLY